MSTTFNCPSCTAPLDYDGEELTLRCPYCNNTVIVPEELRPHGNKATFYDSPNFQMVNMDMDLGSLIGQAVQFKEVIELARGGNKIEAIKRYRQLTGLGLKESKDAVEALISGQSINVITTSGQGFIGEGGEEKLRAEKAAALEKIHEMVKAGHKIEAIRLYRQTFDTGLLESKTAVERMEAGEFETVRNMALESPYIPQVLPPQISVLTSSTSTAVAATAAATTAATAGGVGCLAIFLTIIIGLSVVVPILIALASSGGPLSGVWMKVNPVTFARLTQSFGGEGTGPGLFDDPRGIAVDGEGNIYVADYSDGRIQKFSSSGEHQLLWNIGDESYVGGMAASQDGIVYIAYGGEIWRYRGATGEPLGKLEFDRDHYFDNLTLTADGKLVTISRGEDVLRFDSQGQLDLEIPKSVSSISDDSELDAIVATDGLGNIYVLGTFNVAVFKFSPDGKFITQFGSDGDEKGQLRAPSAIVVDGQGRVYVNDFKGIQVFDGDGRYLDIIDTEGFVFGMVITANNRLLAVSNSPKVYIYSLPSD